MSTPIKHIIIAFVAIAAVMPACKKCSDCAEYLYKDDSKGRPQYSKVSAEFCGDDLEGKQRAIVPMDTDTLVFIPQYQCE